MDPETFRWLVLAAIIISGSSIYDRLGNLHDKAMNARLDHDRRLLERLEVIERQLVALRADTNTLPKRTAQAIADEPLHNALDNPLRGNT